MEYNIKDRFLTKYKKFEINDNNYKQYNNQITKLYNFVREKKVVDSEIELLKQIDGFLMEEFYYYIQDKKYRFNTINTIIICLKDYFNYLCDIHVIEKNYADIMKKYKPKEVNLDKKQKDTLTVNEMKKIIECSYIRKKGERKFNFNSARDRFLIALLFTTGLRISEALEIRLDWIENVEGLGMMINIPKEFVKNHMDKRVPLVNSIRRFYDEYMMERNKIKLEDKKILFVSLNGKQYYSKNANESISKLVDKANIEEKHIVPHSLRHSLTRQLISNRVDVHIIKKTLGWSEEDDIIGVYSGSASDKTYDETKMLACDLFKDITFDIV